MMICYLIFTCNIGEFVLPKPDPPEQIMKNIFYYKILFEYRIGKRTNVTKFSWFFNRNGIGPEQRAPDDVCQPDDLRSKPVKSGKTGTWPDFEGTVSGTNFQQSRILHRSSRDC